MLFYLWSNANQTLYNGYQQTPYQMIYFKGDAMKHTKQMLALLSFLLLLMALPGMAERKGNRGQGLSRGCQD